MGLMARTHTIPTHPQAPSASLAECIKQRSLGSAAQGPTPTDTQDEYIVFQETAREAQGLIAGMQCACQEYAAAPTSDQQEALQGSTLDRCGFGLDPDAGAYCHNVLLDQKVRCMGSSAQPDQ